MQSVYKLFVFLLFLLVLNSCARLAPKLVGDPVSREYADELLLQWHESSAQNFSLSGLARFEMVTPERTVKGNQVLLIEKPDRLRAEVLSMFGSPLLLLAANGEDLDVYLSFENEFYTGSASAENLGRFVRLPLHLQALVGVLLYQPPMITAKNVQGFDLKGQGWLLERSNPPYRQELFFDEEKRLVEVNYYDRSGLSLAIDYGGFVEGNPFPHQFDLKFPWQETTANLKFSDIEINKGIKPDLFQLTVPPGAEVFSLDEQ